MSIADSFTTKIGPAPAWVWGVGAGLTLAVVQRLRARPEPPEPVVTETHLVTGGAESVTLSPSPMGGGSWAVAPSVDSPADYLPAEVETPQSAATNEGWRRTATDWAISSNFDPVTATAAIQKYLDGFPVNGAEEAVVRAVLREFGAPPQGARPLVRVPQPPAASTPTPPPPAPTPAPTPTPPPPAPTPTPTPAPPRPSGGATSPAPASRTVTDIARFNTPQMGTGAFIAFERRRTITPGQPDRNVMRWIQTGDEYATLRGRHPEVVHTATGITNLVRASTKTGPKPPPGYLPVAAYRSW